MLLLVFLLGDRSYALPVDTVERVLRAVEITPVADAPGNVLGLINLQGRVIPVFELRRRLGLPAKELDLGDQFVIARAGGRAVALLVDGVGGIVDCPAERAVAADAVLPGLEGTAGIAALADGMVVIEDLERLFGQSVAEVATAAA